MIIDYDHNPAASYEQKLKSLKESVQMALNEVGGGSTTWQKIKNLFAPLASPTFTGTPTAPTATTGTSTTQVATTEFVANSIGAMMKDFVTDQGTSSSWYYRKWKSGKIEAWTTYNAGSQTPSQWVTGWYYKDVNVAIPSGIFSATPTHVVATNVGSDYQYSVFTACPTSSTSIKVRVVKPNSGAATPVLSIYASNMI